MSELCMHCVLEQLLFLVALSAQAASAAGHTPATVIRPPTLLLYNSNPCSHLRMCRSNMGMLNLKVCKWEELETNPAAQRVTDGTRLLRAH
eukprot:1398185-Amphidinium_carterae.1